MTDKLRSFSCRHCEISSNKKTACLSASAKSPGVFPSQNIALKNYSTVKKNRIWHLSGEVCSIVWFTTRKMLNNSDYLVKF